MYVQAIHSSPKLWTDTGEETLSVYKDEGIRIMISGFQSREFGFGFSWDDLSNTNMKRINDFRAEKSYMDKYAANILRNGVPSRNIYLGKTIRLWCCLSMGILTTEKDIGAMSTLL